MVESLAVHLPLVRRNTKSFAEFIDEIGRVGITQRDGDFEYGLSAEQSRLCFIEFAHKEIFFGRSPKELLESPAELPDIEPSGTRERGIAGIFIKGGIVELIPHRVQRKFIRRTEYAPHAFGYADNFECRGQNGSNMVLQLPLFAR